MRVLLALLAAAALCLPSAGAEELHVVPFSLPDLAGRTWTPADLAGKTALVNVWASWCVPCRDELPFLERVHRAVAGRSDVIVISINIDESEAVGREYAVKHGFTFPVLLGPEFVETHFLKEGGLGIPASWLVDPDGAIRRAPPRFEDKAKGDAWVEAVLRTLAPAAPAR